MHKNVFVSKVMYNCWDIYVDVNLLCKFALLENQHGFGEQAQTLFEHILTSYPKRTDIWNVYVDMLVKSDKVEIARYVIYPTCLYRKIVCKIQLEIT